MAAPAVGTASPPAPTWVPAVGSLALAPLLAMRPRGAVLGSSTHAAWIGLGRRVVVIAAQDATQLPNSVQLSVPAEGDPLRGIRQGDQVAATSDRIAVGPLVAGVTRWWDPRLALPRTSSAAVIRAVAGLPDAVPGSATSRLGDAITRRDAVGLVAASRKLIGRGSGLTPEGDDVLAGAVAAVACLGPPVGDRRAGAMLEAAAPALLAVAAARTTALSVSLLAHAVRGEVAAPAAVFLRAVTGRGDVAAAHATVCSIGHTSGRALAAGMVLGARALGEGGGGRGQ